VDSTAPNRFQAPGTFVSTAAIGFYQVSQIQNFQLIISHETVLPSVASRLSFRV
jgi:hypothetical protein